VAGAVGNGVSEAFGDLANDFCELLLGPAREFVLTLRRDKRIFASHLQIAVPGDFGGFDGTATDLLPPRYIGTPEGVWT